MPKKAKVENKSESVPVATEPALPAPAKPVRTRKKTTKKSPARTRKSKASEATSGTGAAAEPSHEEIRMRAYFIAERRHRFDLPGDADSDWLEAKRQLLAEAATR